MADRETCWLYASSPALIAIIWLNRRLILRNWNIDSLAAFSNFTIITGKVPLLVDEVLLLLCQCVMSLLCVSHSTIGFNRLEVNSRPALRVVPTRRTLVCFFKWVALPGPGHHFLNLLHRREVGMKNLPRSVTTDTLIGSNVAAAVLEGATRIGLPKVSKDAGRCHCRPRDLVL